MRQFVAHSLKWLSCSGTGRRVARLEQLQQELGENFHFLAFDISDRQATEDASIPFPLVGNPLIYW